MVFSRDFNTMSDAVIRSFNPAGLALWHQQTRLNREHQRDECQWEREYNWGRDDND